MKSKIKFGYMINFLRRKDGLSLEEFGNKFNKNKSTISRWISGERYPKVDEIEAIANYYGITINELVLGIDDATSTSEEKTDIF